MNPIINRKQDILYKDLAVDLTAHRVSRAGHELLLTPREFALLAGATPLSARAAPWTYISTACAASSACKTTSRPSTRSATA